jgi:proteasome lid subunit RPN8/RPN11
MPLPENDGGFGFWNAQNSPVRIEYSIAALEKAAAEAVDGLYRFRHGGAEVGGVLYGTVVNGVMRIEAVRPLECEYAFGPRFVLSDRDKAKLVELTEAYEQDPELAGLYPVGWYHSHTRSEIELSPRDMEIYERFFPERWQVALVLRPEQYGPVRAGFFFRERNRYVRSDQTSHEFLIGMQRGQPEVVDGASAAVEADPAPEAEVAYEEDPEGGQPAEALEEPVREPVEQVQDESSSFGEPGPEPEPEPETEPEAAPPAGMLDFTPAFCAPESKRRLRWRWIAALALLAAASGAGVYYYLWTGASQPLSLMATDVGGQLLIEWDRTARPIRDARTAVLMIKDGDQLQRIPLDSDTLHGGSADYTRQSQIIDISLVLDEQGGRARATLRFVGPPVKRNPSSEELQVLRERDELKAEVEKLRDQLQKSQPRRRVARRP